MMDGTTNYVAITAVLVIGGALLAIFVSPWWWILPALLGGGIAWAARGAHSPSAAQIPPPSDEGLDEEDGTAADEEDDDEDGDGERIAAPVAFEGYTIGVYFKSSGQVIHVLDPGGGAAGGMVFTLARLWEADPRLLLHRIVERRDMTAGSACLAFIRNDNAHRSVTGTIGPAKASMEDDRFIVLALSCLATFAAVAAEHGWGDYNAARDGVAELLMREAVRRDSEAIDHVLYDPHGPGRALEALGMAPLPVRGRVLGELDIDVFLTLLRAVPGEAALRFLEPLVAKIRLLVATDIEAMPFPDDGRLKDAMMQLESWMASVDIDGDGASFAPETALDEYRSVLRLLSGLRPSWRSIVLPDFFIEEVRLTLAANDWNEAVEHIRDAAALHTPVLMRTQAISLLIVALERRAASDKEGFESLFGEALACARKAFPMDETDSSQPGHEDMVDYLLHARETVLALRVADDAQAPDVRDNLYLKIAEQALADGHPTVFRGAAERLHWEYAKFVLASLEACDFSTRGDLDAALDAVDRAASRRPRIAALAATAAAHLRAAKMEPAKMLIAELERIARDSDPDDRATIHEYLGELYTRGDREADARALWADENDGETRNRVWRGIVLAHSDAGRYDLALAQSETMDLAFFKADALRLIAERAVAADRADTALNAAEAMARTWPDDLSTAGTLHRVACMPNMDEAQRRSLLAAARDAALAATRTQEGALDILRPIAGSVAALGEEAVMAEFSLLSAPLSVDLMTGPTSAHHPAEALARRGYLAWLVQLPSAPTAIKAHSSGVNPPSQTKTL